MWYRTSSPEWAVSPLVNLSAACVIYAQQPPGGYWEIRATFPDGSDQVIDYGMSESEAEARLGQLLRELNREQS